MFRGFCWEDKRIYRKGLWPQVILVLIHSSVGKESTHNAEDLGSIPGLGRSPGEGTGYPFQHSWASLVAQMVENLPAMQETWIWSLGWEDSLEKGKATHSTILSWRIPKTVKSQRVKHDFLWKWATFTSLQQLNWGIIDVQYTIFKLYNEFWYTLHPWKH